MIKIEIYTEKGFLKEIKAKSYMWLTDSRIQIKTTEDKDIIVTTNVFSLIISQEE